MSESIDITGKGPTVREATQAEANLPRVTKEELDATPKEELDRIAAIAREEDLILMDPNSFQPFIVVEGKRYDVEPG